jgi:hypothetical protein
MTPPTSRVRRRRRLPLDPLSAIVSSAIVSLWFAAVAVYVIPPPSRGRPGTSLSVAGGRPPPAAFRYPAQSRRRTPPVVRGDDGGIGLPAAAVGYGVSPSAVGGIVDANVYDGGWGIVEKIKRALGIDDALSKESRSSTHYPSENPDEGVRGRVIRTAVRPYQASGGSIPSSRSYTTRKPAVSMILVSENGAAGDYNHYRTLALRSTPDRAISILTGDVGSYVRSLDGGYFADVDGDGNDAAAADDDDDDGDGDRRRRGYWDGDLGENVLVDGVDFDYFEVGMRYRISSSSSKSNMGDGGSSADAAMLPAAATEDDVVVEITEPMVPCANLCKLPYINDPKLEPKHRVARCQYFLEALGQREGLRGWYARVVKGGIVRVGDSLSADFAPAT